MKTQLTNKLAEGKEKHKQTMAAEHEQEMEKLKSEHAQELEGLRMRHRDELDELKKQEESRFAQFREKWAFDNPQSRAEIAAPVSGADGQTSKNLTNISDIEAQELVKSNNVVRTILRKNVTTQVDKAKEALSAQLREEHEKDLAEKLAEAQTKANKMKEHAVAMEQKRNQIKVSMSENKAKTAQARIDVVQTAANETPQKPVIEVWNVAQNAKPEAAAAPTSGNAGSPIVQKPTTSSSPGQASVPAQDSQAQGPKPLGSSFGQPSNFGRPNTFGQPSNFGQPSAFPQNNQSQKPNVAAGSFGQPSFAQKNQPQFQPKLAAEEQSAPDPPQQQAAPTQSQTEQPLSNNTSGSPAPSQPSATEQKNTDPTHEGQQPQRQPPSQPGGNIPQKPTSGQNNPFSQGTGQAAARSLQQSGLPIARGGSIRGGGNARGRGQGRGGSQPIDTTRAQGQPQGRNSPTSASLNPSARQFVPGNKRPRDDAQGGQHGDGGGNGKRVRGGGA